MGSTLFFARLVHKNNSLQLDLALRCSKLDREHEQGVIMNTFLSHWPAFTVTSSNMYKRESNVLPK